jgi:hypothetical protein
MIIYIKWISIILSAVQFLKLFAHVNLILMNSHEIGKAATHTHTHTMNIWKQHWLSNIDMKRSDIAGGEKRSPSQGSEEGITRTKDGAFTFSWISRKLHFDDGAQEENNYLQRHH